MHCKEHQLVDVSDDDIIPYFLWDYRYTVGRIKKVQAEGSECRRIWLIAKIMRDVRYCDVWKFISLRDFLRYHEKIVPRLGQQRDFWQFLYSRWIKYGIISDDENSNPAAK